LAQYQYANNPQTTLAGSATAGATTISVASSAGFPSRGKFTIIVDSEIMLVTGVAGTDWTVERGAEDTSAAAHNNNATVTGILTKDSFLNAHRIDVRTYGAVGDDSTDDTAALQAAIDDWASLTVQGELFIPSGTYKITAALEIPYTQGKAIRGDGWNVAVLKQYTDNIPVIKTNAENTHSIGLSDLTLTYANAQTSAQTGAIALNFTLGSAGTGQGWYWWKVNRLIITNAHIGIGIGGPGASGSLAVWNCSFEQIRMSQISQTMIYMSSPTTIGMPVNTFRNITHMGAAVATAGPAIKATACELIFDGLDIEDWTGQIINTVGGSPVTILGLHTERHTLPSSTPMFYVANDSLTIMNPAISAEVTSGAAAVLVQVDTGGTFRMQGGYASATLTSGTITGISAGGRSYEINNVRTTNITLARTVSDAGASFPSSPKAGERRFRTDLGQEFYYDGARWVSTTLYTAQFAYQRSAQPYSASSTFNGAFPHPTLDIYIEDFYGSFNVQTTNDASNYWTATFAGVVLSTQSNAVGSWVPELGVKDAVLANADRTEVTLTKVNAPGNLFVALAFTYRLVAT